MLVFIVCLGHYVMVLWLWLCLLVMQHFVLWTSLKSILKTTHINRRPISPILKALNNSRLYIKEWTRVIATMYRVLFTISKFPITYYIAINTWNNSTVSINTALLMFPMGNLISDLPDAPENNGNSEVRKGYHGNWNTNGNKTFQRQLCRSL